MTEQAVAFEGLVDDYDAARPTYPTALYDALPLSASSRVLELGAGTGIASRELAGRCTLIATDRGPKMLGRLRSHLPGLPAVVARAEAVPFADGSFDGVCGAQMWHWVDAPAAAAEVRRVLRPGGWLAVWWNDVSADGHDWYDAQQDRLETLSTTGYQRSYRTADYAGQLGEHFSRVGTWTGSWEREQDWPTYERWLLSKSYVAALPDVAAFVAAERASLAAAFPDGVIREPFGVRLLTAWT